MPGFEYVPAKCAFKTWLLNLTRWSIVDQIRKRKSNPAPDNLEGTTDSSASPNEIADPAGCALERIWDEEWEGKHKRSEALRWRTLSPSE